MSPSEKKKDLSPLLSLPDELLFSCIARLSRLYYPTLSLVSKRFRSLIASPYLYQTRSSLGNTESCLYVCLHDLCPYGNRWFTLCRKPDQTLSTDENKKKSGGYVLATIYIPDYPPAQSQSLVAVGSNIYNFAGMSYPAPYSSVSILDCFSHTCRKGPSLHKKKLIRPLCASVVDQKIYLLGYYEDDFKNCVEVFDTKTQCWDPVPIPCSEIKGVYFFGSLCIDGKFHVETEREVATYDPKEGKWNLGAQNMGLLLRTDSYCVIDNIIYSVFEGALRWYDTEVKMWRDLEGLVGLPRFPRGAYVRLADYGGKLAVLWDHYWPFSDGHKTVIWCAEIALERRNSCEIWGNVEWFDHVLTVPITSSLVKLLVGTF